MKRWYLMMIILILSLTVAACGSSKTEVESNTTSSDNTVAESASNTVVNVTFREAPLGIDTDFHNDPATFVGATGRPQLLEFYTDWCPTCKSLRTTVHSLEEAYWGTVDFVYLDRENDANKEWVEKFGIRSQPIFVLLSPDGTVIEQWYAGSGEDITTAIDEYLAQAGG